MPILVMIGTKAQFIKTAPILIEMDRRGVSYRLVYTGQHSETFDVLENTFGTRSADDVLVPSFEAATKIRFFDWVIRFWWQVMKRLVRREWKGTKLGIVHGDTASTLFGALAIRLAGGQVGHIEAGLRSPNLFDPMPEEIIRRLVSRLSKFHFAPSPQAANNLIGIGGQVINTQGNTLRDALLQAIDKKGSHPVEGGGYGYVVVSIHRNENLSRSKDFNFLMQTVIEISHSIEVKFVLHPATREKLVSTGWYEQLDSTKGISLLDRMSYTDFVQLLLQSDFLVTDGGSNQEEAAMLGLPTLLMRRSTEREDGLGAGVVLSNLEPAIIQKFIKEQVGQRWTIRGISQESPSAMIVDHMCDIALAQA